MFERGYRSGSLKGDTNIGIDVDADVNADIDSHFGCLKALSKSLQVLLNG